MISLKIEPYCENCAAFTAVTKGLAGNYDLNRKTMVFDTIIKCENAELCADLVAYLKTQIEGAAK